MMHYQSPLKDITNVQNQMIEKSKPTMTNTIVPKNTNAHTTADVKIVARKMRHNPYDWKCLPDDLMSSAASFAEVAAPVWVVAVPPAQDLFKEKGDQAPAAPVGPPMCSALVQFKCRQSEYSSSMDVEQGQYVTVQGDRGIDIGVVIRVNTEKNKTYMERTGSVGSILRYATQAEVDYWATDLKESEAEAVEYCQAQVRRHGFEMEIAHAEYQFDKKKLTFYYQARARIDFVQMLKELYREFGCRIWMEKVRIHE